MKKRESGKLELGPSDAPFDEKKDNERDPPDTP